MLVSEQQASPAWLHIPGGVAMEAGSHTYFQFFIHGDKTPGELQLFFPAVVPFTQEVHYNY